MPNWKKVITSGSDAQLNSLYTSGNITGSDVKIDDWGSISASLASINSEFASTGSNTFKGVQEFSGSLLPTEDVSFNLGSPTKVWDSLYVNGNSIYMRDPATSTFVTMSATSGILTFHNSKLNVPLGFTSITSITGSDVKIDDWGSVSASLSNINETSASVSSRVTTLENAGGVTFSSSIASRVTTLEDATDTYALKTEITGAFASTSSSLASRVTTVEGYTLDNVTDNGSTTTNTITIGGLTVNGNATITGTITAQQFNTEYVSSSVIYESGSTKFGDSTDDIHSFTGSVKLNTETAATTDTDKFLVFDTGGQIKYRTGAQVLSDIGGQGASPGTVSSSAQISGYNKFLEITGDNVISSSAQISGYNKFLEITGDNVISSSAQLTNEFDTRYLNTTGDGVISSSVQVNANSITNFDSNVKDKMNADGVISSSVQIDHDTTTNFVANEHIDHTAVSITAGNGLSGGGTIAATRTLSVDTSSAHFNNGVKTKLNTDGVISSSAQLTNEFDTRYLNTTGDNVISSSAQVNISSTTGYTSFSSSIASDIASIQGSGYVDVSSGGASNRIAIFSDADSLKGDADVTYYSTYNPQSQVYGVWDDVNSEGIKSKTLTTQGIYVGQVGTNFTASIALEANVGPTSFYTETKAVGFNAPTTGTHIIHVDTGYAFFINYHLGDGANYRAGTITINTNFGSSVVFSETSTVDLGDTSAHTFSVGYSSGTMTLSMTTTGGCEGTMEVRRMVSI